jgi:putative PEP-CTERM system TPR-repeat lipoprotein
MSTLQQEITFTRTAGMAAAVLSAFVSAACWANGTRSVSPPDHEESATRSISNFRADKSIRAETPLTVAALITEHGPASQVEAQSDLALAKTHIARNEFDQALEVAERLIRAKPNDPTGYNVQGVAYLGKQDFRNARKSFEKALAVHPGDVPSLTSLAELDVRQKNSESARKRYQMLLDKDPKYVPALIGMANVEALNGKETETLTWLKKAKAAHPEALAPRLALGTYHLRHKDNRAALAELTEAQLFHPDNADLLNLLAEAQAANGEVTDSIATYRKLVATHPDLPLAYYGLGMALSNNKQFAEAAENLQKAIQKKPDFIAASVALAHLEIRSGHPDKAMKLAMDLQKAAPKSAAGLALEGDLLMIRKRYADAAKTYQKAIGVEPTGLLAIKLHSAQAEAGNVKEADAKLEQWMKGHPDDLVVLEYSATRNLKADRNRLAIDQFERVLQKAPNNIFTLNNLAVLYKRENDPRAAATAERAYKLAPGSPMVADTLGWILVEHGATSRGLDLLQKAAAASPDNSEIQYHLAVALAKAGDKAKSRQQLEALLAGDKTFPQREAAEALLKKL